MVNKDFHIATFLRRRVGSRHHCSQNKFVARRGTQNNNRGTELKL